MILHNYGAGLLNILYLKHGIREQQDGSMIWVKCVPFSSGNFTANISLGHLIQLIKRKKGKRNKSIHSLEPSY